MTHFNLNAAARTYSSLKHLLEDTQFIPARFYHEVPLRICRFCSRSTSCSRSESTPEFRDDTYTVSNPRGVRSTVTVGRRNA